MTDRKELKANARQAMAEARPRPAWVTLAVGAIVLVLAVLTMSIDGELDMLRDMFDTFMSTGEILYSEEGEISGLATVLALALELMSMVLSVGYTLYALRVSRRQKAALGDVFDAFGVFFRAIWITILNELLVSFSSICYILPTVLLTMVMGGSALAPLICLPLMVVPYITMYSLRQGVFIMLDNPGIGCMQCLSLSRMAMRGHKWELFKLDLSFIGWYILCIVPFAALRVAPYIEVTRAAYYDRFVPAFIQSIPTVLSGAKPPEPPQYRAPGENRDDDEPRDGGA